MNIRTEAQNVARMHPRHVTGLFEDCAHALATLAAFRGIRVYGFSVYVAFVFIGMPCDNAIIQGFSGSPSSANTSYR